MKQCKCTEIKNFNNIEDTPFVLMPKKEMVCPQIYYMLCKECYHIIPFILKDGTYECISKKGEE